MGHGHSKIRVEDQRFQSSSPISYRKKEERRRKWQSESHLAVVTPTHSSTAHTTAPTTDGASPKDSAEKKIACPALHGSDAPEGFGGKLVLRNLLDEDENLVDTLHTQAVTTSKCPMSICQGSIYQPEVFVAKQRPAVELREHAVDFLRQFFASRNLLHSSQHESRERDVVNLIGRSGFYEQTFDELEFGAKTAWRNAPRCVMRMQWNKLKCFDARHVRTSAEAFDAIIKHIKYASNGGIIQSAISVFPPKADGRPHLRIWNDQFIRYGGYERPDGTVIGDPAGVPITKVCERLGWKGPRGRFDVLPLVIGVDGQDPEFFVIPPELVLEVQISHPEYDWFPELGLKWYGVPAVANMIFDCGGIQYPFAPFNGWYMGAEVGARNFCDASRYNLTEEVGERMGLDVGNNITLWKDKVMLELNRAVLYSYQKAGVSMSDHHTASESFIHHMAEETRVRGGCPADWVWIVPPISGSLTPVFHQEMSVYKLYPAYDYQESPAATHVWKNNWPARVVENNNKNRNSSKVMEMTILFASETGKSEGFARNMARRCKKQFATKVMTMDQFAVRDLERQSLVLLIGSTTGDGDAPDNGTKFLEGLKSLGKSSRTPPLSDTSYAVLALGSTSYANFCSFGKLVDRLMSSLGARSLKTVVCADEIDGQDRTFKNWSGEIVELAAKMIRGSSPAAGQEQVAAAYRLAKSSKSLPHSFNAMSTFHGKSVAAAEFISAENLQSSDSGRETLLVKLREASLQFSPGDHLLVFPEQPDDEVTSIVRRLAEDADDAVVLELNEGGPAGKWTKDVNFPVMTLRLALRQYVDVTSPPSQSFLQSMAALPVNCPNQKEKLNILSENDEKYEEWKMKYWPSVAYFLTEFNALEISAAQLLAELPKLSPRYYSISSCRAMHPHQIHLTVGVLQFCSGDGKIHNGVTSNWFRTLTSGDSVHCLSRKAQLFRQPTDQTAPMVLIGPGTGIAPFRSFWQHRQWSRQQGERLGDCTVYFGCRKPEQDDIFRSELEECVTDGCVTQVHKAFSRLQARSKTYVQDLIGNHWDRMFELMTCRGGHIYVCGDAAMAGEVKNALQSILVKGGKFGGKDAADYLAALKSENRYHEDIFGVALQKLRSDGGSGGSGGSGGQRVRSIGK